MPEKTMTLSEGEQFVIWMLRSLEKPGAPEFAIHATSTRVTLLVPGSEMQRPDDVVGRGHTLAEAHTNLKAAMRTPPHT